MTDDANVDAAVIEMRDGTAGSGPTTNGERVSETGDDDQGVEEQMADLEAMIEDLEQTQKVIRETTIKPRIESLQEELNDARGERQSLREELDETREVVAELRTELEAIAGLADDQATNPEKRLSDLRHVLIRRAKANDHEVSKMYWQEVQDAFADLGHGEIARPMCYDAMEQLAEQQGFSESKKTSASGNRVKCVKVELGSLRRDIACSDPTTRNTTPEGQKPGMEVTK